MLFSARPGVCQCVCHWPSAVMLCGPRPIRSCGGAAYRSIFLFCRNPNADTFFDLATWIGEGIITAFVSAFCGSERDTLDWIERHSDDPRARRTRARAQWASHWCEAMPSVGREEK